MTYPHAFKRIGALLLSLSVLALAHAAFAQQKNEIDVSAISVPDGYNAHLEAGTTNGPVSLGFPITVVGRITRDISTDLGSGGATIRATTTNGPLSIRRK